MIQMSSASDKKSNFFFANCMHCEGIIRIPIAIRPDSYVSCPHCSSQFELIEFMDQIPEVEVAGGVETNGQASVAQDEFHIETEEAIEQQDGKFVVPPQLAKGIKKRRRRRRRSSESSSSSSNQQMSEAEELRQARRAERADRERAKIQSQRESANAVDPKKRRGSSSRRKTEPKRNPLLEGLKIVFGGLLAAPIAYLLLMWVFSRDPLGLVPTINSYAPILVPEALVFDGGDDQDQPKATDEDTEDTLQGLPVPDTDPDDVDPLKVDLDL